MREQTISFVSHGLKLSAWLFLPEGMARPPVVVMAHGFGATRVLGLRPFAERFVAAGIACLVFDYRNFGDSEGEPRNSGCGAHRSRVVTCWWQRPSGPQ